MNEKKKRLQLLTELCEWMRRPDTSGKARAAATGNARLPSVDRRVDGTTSVDALADLRRLRVSTSVVKWSVSTLSKLYGGADNDGSGHTTDTEFSPELSANEVHGEVELCVLISSPRTLVERRRSAPDWSRCISDPDTPVNAEPPKSSFVRAASQVRGEPWKDNLSVRLRQPC